MTIYSADKFFALSSLSFKGLFFGSVHVWEVLPKIHDYILSLPLGTINSPIPKECVLLDEHLIFIEEGVEIEPQSYIKGPCVLQKGAKVRQGAYIRGNVIAAPRSVIGHATEVKNSVLLENAHAAHFAYVGDSILGNDSNLGAGTKLANLKLNGSNIWVGHGTEKVDTKLRKFGAIIGDRAQTGCNSVTNPGTFLDQDACIMPCSSVRGHIQAESIRPLKK